MNPLKVFVLLIVCSTASAVELNKNYFEPKNTKPVCTNFKISYLRTLVDSLNCSKTTFHVSFSDDGVQMPEMLHHVIKEKFSTTFEASSLCNEQGAKRCRLIFTQKKAPLSSKVVRLEKVENELIESCVSGTFKIEQKFKLNDSDWFDLLLSLDWCKYSRYVGAFGEFYLFNKINNPEKLNFIKIENSDIHFGAFYTELNFTEPMKSISNSRKSKKFFEKNCKNIVNEEFETHIILVVAAVFAIPLLGIMTNRLIKLIISYTNRNKVYPFTP